MKTTQHSDELPALSAWSLVWGYMMHLRLGSLHSRNDASLPAAQAPAPNPLIEYARRKDLRRGFWKFEHYFDLYHRHLQKFVGAEVHIVEIGILDGGSLDMWRHYFGPRCHVYGIDLNEKCLAFANEKENIKVFIGDQGSAEFWNRFRREVPKVDVLIDDGSHFPHHQMMAVEEMLPHLSSNGVLIVEDTFGRKSNFTDFVAGLAHSLNDVGDGSIEADALMAGRPANPLQRSVHSIHQYPYVTVIEKTAAAREKLTAPFFGAPWSGSKKT